MVLTHLPLVVVRARRTGVYVEASGYCIGLSSLRPGHLVHVSSIEFWLIDFNPTTAWTLTLFEHS